MPRAVDLALDGQRIAVVRLGDVEPFLVPTDDSQLVLDRCDLGGVATAVFEDRKSL